MYIYLSIYSFNEKKDVQSKPYKIVHSLLAHVFKYPL